MNRLLSILLIPFFVLGQTLPHSHAGSGMVEREDHASRPHLHLSSADSHDHDGEVDPGHDHHHGGKASDESTKTKSLSATLDHDSDAIYVVQSNSTLARSTAFAKLSFVFICTLSEVFADRLDRPCLHRSNQLPDRSAGLPIYLLVASLRL